MRLDSPNWKEAFLHPRDAYGIVIQVAQQSGKPPLLAAPAELPAPGPACAFALIEHHVSDLDGATRLFRDVLDGEIASRAPAGDHQAAELTWRNGARLRLVQDLPPAAAGPASAALRRRTDGRRRMDGSERAARSARCGSLATPGRSARTSCAADMSWRDGSESRWICGTQLGGRLGLAGSAGLSPADGPESLDLRD